eukprot:c25657_g1_i1 orf=240-1214(+)
MGGGTVFRGMARLMGVATAGAAAVPTTGALCHVHPPALTLMKEQESLLPSLNHSQKGLCGVKSNPKEFGSSVDVRFEFEEHDCSLAKKEEGSSGAALRGLVFSLPPTEEEVEEATKELHAALHLSMPAGGYLSEEDHRLDDMGALTSCEDGMNTAPKASDKRVTSISLPSSQHLSSLAVESSPVMQAFQLLQTNSKVQDVVKSLACDPAVWSALLNNEKMQEELAREDPFDIEESNANVENSTLQTMDPNERTFSKVYGFVTTRTKVYYSFVKGKLFSILNSMFGSMEKTIFSKEGTSTMDKTKASCMMLAVAVLIVVVLRRSH